MLQLHLPVEHLRKRSLRATVNRIVVLLLCVPGCGGHAGSAPRDLPQVPDERWRLTFLVSGGFAGLDRELELASSGAATATNRRPKRQVSRLVTGDELQEIDQLVASAASLDVPNRTQCRDCLSYHIDVRSSGKQVTIRAGDDGLGDSNTALLIRALTRLLDRLLLSEP